MRLFKQLAELEKSVGEIADRVRELALKVEYQRGFAAGQLEAITKLAQRLPQAKSQTERSQNASGDPKRKANT